MLQRRCSLEFSRFRIYPGKVIQSSAGSGYIQLQISRVQDISSFRYPGFTVVRYIQGSSRSGYIQVQISRVHHGQDISIYRYPGFNMVGVSRYIYIQGSSWSGISRCRYPDFIMVRIYPGIYIQGLPGSGYIQVYISSVNHVQVYPLDIQGSPRSGISKVHV